jgi:hypothetical protein
MGHLSHLFVSKNGRKWLSNMFLKKMIKGYRYGYPMKGLDLVSLSLFIDHIVEHIVVHHKITGHH